jgi:hypothetical protein
MCRFRASSRLIEGCSFFDSEMPRIIGFREDAVLHIIWIDPHHRAYAG